MKTRFKIRQSKWANGANALLAAVIVVNLVVSAINLSKWQPSENSYFGVDVAAVVLMSVLLTVQALLAFNSRYVLGQAKLKVVFGVFFVGVRYDRMKQIRTDGQTFLLYYVVPKKEGDKITYMKLYCEDAEGLSRKLCSLNDKISYEIMDTE